MTSPALQPGVPMPDGTSHDRDDDEARESMGEPVERWPVTDWRPEWEDGRDA